MALSTFIGIAAHQLCSFFYCTNQNTPQSFVFLSPMKTMIYLVMTETWRSSYCDWHAQIMLPILPIFLSLPLKVKWCRQVSATSISCHIHNQVVHGLGLLLITIPFREQSPPGFSELGIPLISLFFTNLSNKGVLQTP